MGKIIRNGIEYGGGSGEDIPVYTTAEYEEIKDTIPEGTKFIISDDYQEEVDNDYQEKINSHVYTQIGVVNGCEPGYLRQLNKPKKIVVIGNSITMHGRREADGIEWTVDDYREMAAEYPNTGWVGLLKRYISEYINPDCEVWKANGSTWEVQPNGTRKYEHMADMTCAQVFDDGPNYRSDITIDKILDKDVDIVIFQLSENCPEPTTDQAIADMATDFMQLYITVARKCPKAKIYEFCGFWQNLNKVRAMVGACFKTGVVPIQPLTFLEGFNTTETISMQSSPGTKIYDANGNVIATVSGAVAGHPGDQGFQVMAAYVINALYNEITYNSDQNVLLFSRNSKYNAPNLTEMFHTGEDGSLETVNELYTPYFDYFLTPGKYAVTISYGSAGTHGYLDVENAQTIAGNLSTFRKIEEEEALKQKCDAYLTLRQRYTSINNDVPSIERKVILSALNTVFRPFYIPSPISPIMEYENLREVKLNKTLLGYDCYSVTYIIPSDIILSPSSWTHIFSFSSSSLHIPRHVLSFNIVGDTSLRVIDGRSNSPGYRYLIDGYGNLNMASNLLGDDQTILKDSVLIIEYSTR